MELTLLGTGNPLPEAGRGGTCVAVTAGGDTLLLDCGPRTVGRLVEHGIDMAAVEDVFFSHHHVDHDAGFFDFAVTGWSLGRDALTVYGPPETAGLLDALETAYRPTVESWRKWENLVGDEDPERGISDVVHREVGPGFEATTDDWRATAMPVDHDEAMACYAYRIEERATGDAVVFSGDTRRLPAMSAFADGADVLIHDCNALEPDEPLLDEERIPDTYLRPPFEDFYRSYFDESSRSRGRAHHTTATGAATVAAEADVGTLVLTHLNLYRDRETIRGRAERAFDGPVHVADDGLTLSTTDSVPSDGRD